MTDSEALYLVEDLFDAAIQTLARDFAGAKAAVCYGRLGLCTQDFGGTAAWLLLILAATLAVLWSFATVQLTRAGLKRRTRQAAG